MFESWTAWAKFIPRAAAHTGSWVSLSFSGRIHVSSVVVAVRLLNLYEERTVVVARRQGNRLENLFGSRSNKESVELHEREIHWPPPSSLGRTPPSICSITTTTTNSNNDEDEDEERRMILINYLVDVSNLATCTKEVCRRNRRSRSRR